MHYMNKNNIAIPDLFRGLQAEMEAKLGATRSAIQHATTKGTASEGTWSKFLEEYLPERYSVSSGFVVDHTGKLSKQQDIVVFDRQFTPFLFKYAGGTYIPREAVYAVFEVKQTITKSYLEQAVAQAASTLKLRSTSAPVVDKGETKPGRKTIAPISGFLCFAGKWSDLRKRQLKKQHADRERGALDIGVSIEGGAFWSDRETGTINFGPQKTGLADFYLALFSFLQSIGTVPAIELDKYHTLRGLQAARKSLSTEK